MCKKCESNPVYILDNGKKLCNSHFTRYYEKKVFRTIAKYSLLEKGDKIAVAASGGKDSTTLLYILKKFCKERRFCKVEALAIDEGIKGYRDKSLSDLKKFCKKNKIKLHVFSFKKEFGFSLDEILIKARKKKIKLNSCYICGILRRYLINKYARKLKFTKLATGHNLDDEAQTIIMNQFKGNVALSANLGPKTGTSEDESFAQRIKPLYLCTEKENMIYSFIHNIVPHYTECPYQESYRFTIRDFLNKFEAKNPGIKNSIVKSFLEFLPLLKKKYKDKKTLKKCKKCKEPSSKDTCKTCELLAILKNKK
ncbi:MAG: TIGR00269 family protein [Nanoarchaeota archaeon]|nr:TIGR00269 family protein [Nanoarchaeota archaeon]